MSADNGRGLTAAQLREPSGFHTGGFFISMSLFGVTFDNHYYYKVLKATLWGHR